MFIAISLKGEQTANKWRIKLKHSMAFGETKNLDYLSIVHLKTNLFLGAHPGCPRKLFANTSEMPKRRKTRHLRKWLVATNLTRSIHI
jgi:hypothetical protein